MISQPCVCLSCTYATRLTTPLLRPHTYMQRARNTALYERVFPQTKKRIFTAVSRFHQHSLSLSLFFSGFAFSSFRPLFPTSHLCFTFLSHRPQGLALLIARWFAPGSWHEKESTLVKFKPPHGCELYEKNNYHAEHVRFNSNGIFFCIATPKCRRNAVQMWLLLI